MSEKNEQQEHPNPGEQGRASHSTGSTTQGGSNFGQGSSHLGGESYQQGSVGNKGANYENESDKLGNSTTGTNEEGSSSPGAGGGFTEQPAANVDKNTERGNPGWNGEQDHEEAQHGDRKDEDARKLFDSEDRDTSLEQSSGMGSNDNNNDKDAGDHSRGWSSSTINDDEK